MKSPAYSTARAVVAALGFSFFAATTSLAGDQYVDETGYAVSGYDVVAYFGLPQSKVGQAQVPAVPGRSDITAKYNGAVFAFSSTKNRDLFAANPTKYLPQYDGHCAYGVAQGGKVPANPELWRIVDGKLYLNITETVESFWEEDIRGNLNKSERNWRSLERQAASNRTIPQFSSSAPVR